MLLLLALASATPVSAAEDGGTRSPFARGGGERGPGMGGAYVAVADDATAAIWNPGGLGLVPRLTVEVGQTWLGEADANERLVAVAFPSWRWGTLGLCFRHLGVGGIDQRDAADQPIAGDLSVTESELALAFGRPVARGLSVGAAVKMQRQVFGDLSATGLGADLGARVDAGELLGGRLPWAAPFSVGLTMRNLIEPSLRLTEDPVHDPRSMRAGLAWRHVLPYGAQLTLGTDLEHASGLSPRLSTGAELNVGALGSVRGGLNQGGVTAGMSLRWSGWSLEYAFEDRELGSVQRFGLTRSIGRSVAESREAARSAEQSALDARLEEAFESRRREQLRDLVARAESAAALGQSQDAIDAATAAQALAPGDSTVSRLAATLWRDEAGRWERAGDPAGAVSAYARALESWPGDSLAASGRRRAQAELESVTRHRAGAAVEIDSAYGALASGDLLAARRLCARLRAEGLRDPDLLSALARVEEVLGQRIAGRVDAVRRDLDQGRLDAADRGITELVGLGVPGPEIDFLRRDLAQRLAAKRGAERSAVARATPPVATPEQQAEAERLYRRGLAVASRSSAEATRYWEWAHELDPAHRGASEALKREYLLRGMEAFGRGRLDEADRQWKKVLEIDPNDARARGYLERARVQVERTHELTVPGGAR
jgi:tetratricopeptide (TPR) repeat protein